jgi:mRNA (guanine-N7-)-methyltransferase
MPYPTKPGRCKHDLTSLNPLPSLDDQQDELMSRMGFASSGELFKKLLDDLAPPQSSKICAVYSYDDGPEYPGPLSRVLPILGFADQSVSLVRRIVMNDEVPDGLHQCTIAVKLADARHYGQLKPHEQDNSIGFAKLMVTLRRLEAVAILGKDKYQRFGILVPLNMRNDGGANDSSEYTANDFAAMCYTGDVKEVMQFLSTVSRGDTTDTNAMSTKGGDVGGKNGIRTRNEDMKNNNDHNNNNKNDDDDGPVYRAEDDDDNDKWTPGGTGGRSNENSFSAPWDTSGGDGDDGYHQESSSSGTMPWESQNDDSGGGGGSSSMPWDTHDGGEASNGMPWESGGNDHQGTNKNKRSFDEVSGSNDHNNGDDDDDHSDSGEKFHANTGAAAADAFYSGLTRSLDTRANSYLYHMRAFNGWVKATQIAELDPRVIIKGKVQPKQPLRVLDLACGKGGDLTKWTIHDRGMKHYVGIDVARGSLKDAAIRAREMRRKNKLSHAVFSCADLGDDVPGRKKGSKSKHLQKLLTWSLDDEAEFEMGPPEFRMVRGGGISETDRFDIVSIQFAIHYMMQTSGRARRFFHTVSQLLEMGGNLVFTTIDARVILDHMMNLGHDYFFEDGDDTELQDVVVEAGSGACKLRFEPQIVKKIMTSTSDGSKAEDDLFGLEYTFTLVEGSDHASGVGDAVNLPEWLIPLPVLVALGKEAGLELEYAQNFHDFYEARKDPSEHRPAHQALLNMKVPNRNGTISAPEWSVSRLYIAVRFRKIGESTIVLDETTADDPIGVDDGDDDGDNEPDRSQEEHKVELDPIKAKAMVPMAMMKAKKAVGDDTWKTLSSEAKNGLMQIELEKLARK